MDFLKKYKNFIVAGVLTIVLAVLVWPIFSLLTYPKTVFNFQLFALTLILILLLVGAFIKFVRGDWKNDNLIALTGLFFVILFFVSDASQKDLATINALTAITSYNCIVATGILKDKDSERYISYGYYDTDMYLQNLGFAHEKHGSEIGRLARQVAYNMVYSNRLLDSIVRVNAPTDSPGEAKRFIGNTKSQVVALAQEIDDIVGCSNVKSK